MAKIICLAIIHFMIIFNNNLFMIKKENIRSGQNTSQKFSSVSIITIYDNYQSDPNLTTGWGFSCLVKINDQNILFDTGADSQTLLANMEELKINSQEIDFVFISHLHSDHTGGLAGVQNLKPDLKIYKSELFSSFTKKL